MSDATTTLARNYPPQTTLASQRNKPAPNTMHGQFVQHPLGCATYGEYVSLRVKLDALLDAPARVDEWVGGRAQQWLLGCTVKSAADRLRFANLQKLVHHKRVFRVVLVGTGQVIREYGVPS